MIPTQKYFMPAELIGIPLWNLFCIPSLFMEQYREYREYISSGLIMSTIVIVCLIFSDNSNQYLLFLFFPIVHMIVYASSDLSAYIPGIHILTRCTKIVQGMRSQMQEQNTKTSEIHYSYEERQNNI